MSMGSRRDEGNALILSLMLVFFMVALSAAQFAVVQKNIQQSEFFGSYEDLRQYADSGAFIAVHDLRYAVTKYQGNVGTTRWSNLDDVGRDGLAATGDEGEGDGLPTPGEPNLEPQAVGPSGGGIGLLVYVADSAWGNVKRIVSTAFRGDAIATVETFARRGTTKIPRVGAMYMDSSVLLDLKGQKFTISGHDMNPDGTPGPGPSMHAIATEAGDPPGSNESAIVAQIPTQQQDQIIGSGSNPSVGETSDGVDIDELFEGLKARSTQTIASGTYADVTWGTDTHSEITYVNGDLSLSGIGTGMGVLLVDGNVDLSGQFDFKGIVIVRGEMWVTGGGAGIHVFGTLMITQVLTLLDDDASELAMSGSADIQYSSSVLDSVESSLAGMGSPYTLLYWNTLR